MLSAPAWALDCTFTAECVEQEACADSAFTASLTDDQSTLETEFGPLSVTPVEGTEPPSFVATGSGMRVFLTVYGPDARMSVHMDDAFSLSYFGTCE
ncbi:MAG: hypothetical protein AAFY03_05230 [Pseudomonadota bacterium]